MAKFSSYPIYLANVSSWFKNSTLVQWTKALGWQQLLKFATKTLMCQFILKFLTLNTLHLLKKAVASPLIIFVFSFIFSHIFHHHFIFGIYRPFLVPFDTSNITISPKIVNYLKAPFTNIWYNHPETTCSLLIYYVIDSAIYAFSSFIFVPLLQNIILKNASTNNAYINYFDELQSITKTKKWKEGNRKYKLMAIDSLAVVVYLFFCIVGVNSKLITTVGIGYLLALNYYVAVRCCYGIELFLLGDMERLSITYNVPFYILNDIKLSYHRRLKIHEILVLSREERTKLWNLRDERGSWPCLESYTNTMWIKYFNMCKNPPFYLDYHITGLITFIEINLLKKHKYCVFTASEQNLFNYLFKNNGKKLLYFIFVKCRLYYIIDKLFKPVTIKLNNVAFLFVDSILRLLWLLDTITFEDDLDPLESKYNCSHCNTTTIATHATTTATTTAHGSININTGDAVNRNINTIAGATRICNHVYQPSKPKVYQIIKIHKYIDIDIAVSTKQIVAFIERFCVRLIFWYLFWIIGDCFFSKLFPILDGWILKIENKDSVNAIPGLSCIIAGKTIIMMMIANYYKQTLMALFWYYCLIIGVWADMIGLEVIAKFLLNDLFGLPVLTDVMPFPIPDSSNLNNWRWDYVYWPFWIFFVEILFFAMDYGGLNEIMEAGSAPDVPTKREKSLVRSYVVDKIYGVGRFGEIYYFVVGFMLLEQVDNTKSLADIIVGYIRAPGKLEFVVEQVNGDRDESENLNEKQHECRVMNSNGYDYLKNNLIELSLEDVYHLC